MNYFFTILLSITLFSCSKSNNKIENTSVNKELNELIATTDSLKAEADFVLHRSDNNGNTSEVSIGNPSSSKEIKKLSVKKNGIKKVNKTLPKVKNAINNSQKIRPNHTAWNLLTKKYVSSTGKVNYIGFKSKIKQLESYLLHLGNTPPKSYWSKYEKLAYWFNLYNAATIQLISKSYPIKSVKNINNGKPWDKVFVVSGAKTYSLNQIENIIVRPNFNEPRLHVAFNCAAISCPKLLNEAFTPAKLNIQLNRLAKEWINDLSKNNITSNDIEISKIFEWYSKDFRNGVIPFINEYSNIKISESTNINYLKYNWSLND